MLKTTQRSLALKSRGDKGINALKRQSLANTAIAGAEEETLWRYSGAGTKQFRSLARMVRDTLAGECRRVLT